MTNSPKLSSDVTSKEATKLYKSHLSLLHLFGLFIRITNSSGMITSLCDDVFYSYNRILFWVCILHVTCLCVPFVKPFRETMWSQGMLPPWWRHHMSSAILPLPRDMKTMGNTILSSSRKIIINLWLKFSRLIQFLCMLFLLHWSVKDWTKGRVFVLEMSYKLLRNPDD
jgi:hypothetical protein